MKHQLRFVCAGLFILALALSVNGCAGTPTPAHIPTNTPPPTLTPAPTNTPLPTATNTLPPSPTATKPPATATTAPSATSTVKPTSTPTTAPTAAPTSAPTTAATKATSAPTATAAAATSAPTATTAATTAATTTGQSGTNASSAGAVSKDMCLACHGPYDKLATSTASYVAPSGEKGTPHRFVPHDATATVNIPECSNCHTPHPIPPTANMKVTPANVDWCYSTCHHQNDFTPCKQCHNQ